jgi:orotidine-5'-phosphate decarboxylase
MANLAFNDRLNMLISSKSSLLCIGLDPDLEKIPAEIKYQQNPIKSFTEKIVDATKDVVVAYKANLAFYECEGVNGIEALEHLRTVIPEDALFILDGKHADISNSARMYAKAYFKEFGADAITVNPYMGYDAIEPFIQDAAKGVFVLALTSNSGSEDFQNLQVGKDALYQVVARKTEKWNTRNNMGLVVGAADSEGMEIIRRTTPMLPFLVPGIGAQGGNLEHVLAKGRDPNGTGMIINVGRDILYASDDSNFAEKARDKAVKYNQEINGIIRTSWNYI